MSHIHWSGRNNCLGGSGLVRLLELAGIRGNLGVLARLSLVNLNILCKKESPNETTTHKIVTLTHVHDLGQRLWVVLSVLCGSRHRQQSGGHDNRDAAGMRH
jgi:hypothetical protein